MVKKNRLLSAALPLFALTLILYLTTGRNEFNPNLSAQVFVPLILAIPLCISLLIRPVRPLGFLLYLLGLFSWLEYLVAQVNYIVNVFVSIDGTTFSAPFLVITASGLLAWLLSLFGALAIRREDEKEAAA